MKLNASFLEKINNTDKLWPDSSRKKGRGLEPTKLEKKYDKITTDTIEIQNIIRDYYMQTYANKMENPEEMDKFSERYNI